jgi:hypothetical protein
MTNIDKIEKIAGHRNGISGNAFRVVLFRSDKQNMIGIVFDEPGNCAVFDVDLLSKKVIEFGENSWRAEHFEADLRKAIEKWEEE